MKYMTKEWYETMQKSFYHLSLRVSKKAEVFSEDYFKYLYKKEEKAWLRLKKDASKLRFEDVYLDDFHAEYADGRPLEASEMEEAKKEYLKKREEARLNFANIAHFDREQEKIKFNQTFKNNVNYLQRNLPDKVLQKVVDIRVLALNRTSDDIKKEITTYCKANESAVNLALKSYWKGYKENFINGEPSFAENFNFHDCKVISCSIKGKDLILTLDNSGGFTDINEVIFKNYSIIKQDSLLLDAWWLYEEIYKSDIGYEIHALLEKNELIDFIVTASDVELNKTQL